MGINVEFHARPFGIFTDDEVAEIREAFIAEMPFDFETNGRRYPDFGWDEYTDEPTLSVRTLHRYYGIGYERGDWPFIRRMGDWLALHLGERAELRYGGDCDDGWDELRPWAEVRSELDAHWQRYQKEPYRAYFRRS